MNVTRASLLAGALALAACAAPEPPRPTMGAGFDPAAATIQIAVRDKLPLRAATLVLPDGHEVAAHEITVSPPPKSRERSERPGVGVGATGGSSSGVDTAVFIDLPISLDFLRRKPPPSTLTESRARIPVGDGAIYRRDWAASHLKLKLGDPPGEVREIELPAPAP